MAIRLLALDLGAESGRAVPGTLAGDRLEMAQRHRFANVPIQDGRRLFWDVPALWESIRRGLRDAGKLDGIAVDTWGVDYGLLDRAGQLIGQPYHYRDARNEGVMEEAFEGVSRQRIYEWTGIQFLQINTLFQLMAHLREEPDSIKRAESLLFMPDLFRFLLSGARHTEASIASTSQMYDPRHHAWADELIAQLGLPRRLLPPIQPVGHMSMLREDVARACGIEPCPVITTAGHDTAAAVAAVPARGQDWCYISSGTWSLMGIELPRPIINAESLRMGYTNEVGIGLSIRFLKNIMGLWLVQECRRELGRRGADLSYDQLTEMAARASCEAVIDPNHQSLLAPGDMPAKIDQFCRNTKQPVPADPGQLIRCCLQSLALAYRNTLQGLEQITGRRFETIHIVGGGSKNQLLNQMTADACNRAVIAGPAEATAVGNLLMQAMALGAVGSLAHLRQIVARSFPVERFTHRQPDLWDSLYHRYLEVATP